MKRQRLSLTVGITTCYGDPSILDTVKSVRASRGVDDFRFIIVADSVPISGAIKEELKKYRVELVENKEVAGQVPKKKQIIEKAKSDVIIFTQDDVLFEQDTVASILNRFERNSKTKLISIRKQPIASESFFEDTTKVGTRVINRIARRWNGGDNYLATVGRCMAVRTDWVRRYNLPDNVISSDAYFYFENKRLGGGFEYLPNVAVFYRKPGSLKEHHRKSIRFQYQRKEMTKYFGDVGQFYEIPKMILFRAVLSEFVSRPIHMIVYLSIYAYTHLFKQDMKKALTPVWEVDYSTKKLV